MPRFIFFIALPILILNSCSSSVYYAYEKDDTYCTIEVTKKDQIFYRGNYQTFIYLESYNLSLYDNKKNVDFLSFDAPGWMAYKIKNDNLFNLCPSSTVRKITYQIKNADTINLICPPCVTSILSSEPCFINNGIDWFPPYMIKVYKIDYNKFGLSGFKKAHLKNPEKAPMLFE